MSKVVHYFPNTDMRCSHDGLSLIAKKAGFNEIGQGDFLLFVNRAKTHLKVLTTNHIVAHYRSPSGRVDLGAIQYLPLAFAGEGFDFNRALKAKLEKDLAKRGIKVKP